MADHSRLGRGLAALIGDVGEETSVADSGRKGVVRRSKICALIRGIRVACLRTKNSMNCPIQFVSAE